MTNGATSANQILTRLKNHPLLATVTILGMLVLAIWQFAETAVNHWLFPQRGVEVDAVRVIEDSQAIERFRKTWLGSGEQAIRNRGFFPLIEVVLRNPASSTSFLTGMDFDVTRRLHREYPAFCQGVSPTWEYNLLLDTHRASDRQRLDLSQLVDPNSVDRFVIAVGHTGWQGRPTYAEYDITLTLHYNEGRSLPLGRFSLAIDSPRCGLGQGQDVKQVRYVLDAIKR